MTSNLLKRIDRIEDLLGDEPHPGELSPALQESVDRLLKRLGNAEKVSEDSEGEKMVNKQAKSLASGSNGQLNEKQQRLIPYIIGSHTVEEGCREAGISTVTYYEYLKDDLFAKELKKARDGAVGAAMETLKNATTKAVNELVTLLDSKDENIRRRAAVDVLTFITKWREFNEIEDRLMKIERVVIERRSYS